jgi:hypothetical protein
MTPKDIIRLWPNQQEMADDLGIKMPTVAAWSRRNRISAKFHFAIVEAAKRRGYALDYKDVVEAHAVRKDATPSEAA